MMLIIDTVGDTIIIIMHFIQLTLHDVDDDDDDDDDDDGDDDDDDDDDVKNDVKSVELKIEEFNEI